MVPPRPALALAAPRGGAPASPPRRHPAGLSVRASAGRKRSTQTPSLRICLWLGRGAVSLTVRGASRRCPRAFLPPASAGASTSACSTSGPCSSTPAPAAPPRASPPGWRISCGGWGRSGAALCPCCCAAAVRRRPFLLRRRRPHRRQQQLAAGLPRRPRPRPPPPSASGGRRTPQLPSEEQKEVRSRSPHAGSRTGPRCSPSAAAVAPPQQQAPPPPADPQQRAK